MTKLILLTTTILFTFIHAADPECMQSQYAEVSLGIHALIYELGVDADEILNNSDSNWQKLSNTFIDTALTKIKGNKTKSILNQAKQLNLETVMPFIATAEELIKLELKNYELEKKRNQFKQIIQTMDQIWAEIPQSYSAR